MIPISDENPTRTRPYVTWALIAACVLVYIWEVQQGPNSKIFIHYGFMPNTLMSPQFGHSDVPAIPAFATVFTSMFLHGGLLHLGGNMLYLWIFGNNIEEAMGHMRFFVFYFLSGIAAALTMAYMDPSSGIPMVGASGAISGVLGAYMLLYPRARVTVLVPLLIIFYPFRIAAVWVVGIWFAMQLFSATMISTDSPGVAWWAHVGGFVAGAMLTPFLKSAYVRYFGPQRGPWG